MAQSYYTYDQGRVNGQIAMNVYVFDVIVKETVSKMESVSLDLSKGFTLPGTKSRVLCSIKNNEIFVEIHVRIKYGVKVSIITKQIQENIQSSIKELTGIDVKHIDVIVDDIEF